MSTRYRNLYTLEDEYGINLIPIETFAVETYQEINCDCFKIK